MKVLKLIEKLYEVLDSEGDIEVTCTGSTEAETPSGLDRSPFETTVENLIVGEWSHGKKVRLWL